MKKLKTNDGLTFALRSMHRDERLYSLAWICKALARYKIKRNGRHNWLARLRQKLEEDR